MPEKSPPTLAGGGEQREQYAPPRKVASTLGDDIDVVDFLKAGDDVPLATRAAYGLTDRLLRLSVGIEDPDDLVADLERALTAAWAAGRTGSADAADAVGIAGMAGTAR